MLYKVNAEPDFSLGVLYISLFTLELTMPPAHIGSGSRVTAIVVPSSLHVLYSFDAALSTSSSACAVGSWSISLLLWLAAIS